LIRLLARSAAADVADVSDDAPDLASLTSSEAESLAALTREADLRKIASAADFPDWLGYLGMTLLELVPFREHRLRIGRAWAPQFIAMGGAPAVWNRLQHDPISWRDLETAETERLGA
jgi:hypothetical protein